MRAKMKRYLNCKTLLGNSSKVCSKCGSKDLEKGIYTDVSNSSVIYNKHLPKNEI
jgi:RNA polymerase subunit RPABC4/transcription elongation factor Spt4